MLDQVHMASLFENATEGIILTGKDGIIVQANPAAERMFCYEKSELEGQPIEVLIPNRYQGHHHQLREGFYTKPSNRVMGHNRDLHGRRKDGTDLPVEVSLSHYTRDGQLFVIAFVVDITARKEIEHNMLEQQRQLEKVSTAMSKLNSDLEMKVEERTLILKEALQRLEQSQLELSDALDKERQLNEIKSRFVSMASHEFRTPLSTVLSSASLLSKYTLTEEQEKRSRHIDKIKNSVRHLNDILEDFLSLGKLDEGKVGTTVSVFDLKHFAEETIEEMKGLLKAGQHIGYAYSGPNEITCDRKLLKNILINLLTNAIKFSDEGKEIRVSIQADASKADITVADQGIGISAEDQAHMFTSFFRGSNAINIAGTGLGLHIVKRYADLMEGSVHLQSELNKGTSITVRIPSRNL
ncbi:MAG: PAS domain-containing sensor histidine kinase [Chitinophagaceae bacterium]|nr:MAG: PAS domain-containing sensor histidine kinase [Chitinophagaceae bacterium]